MDETTIERKALTETVRDLAEKFPDLPNSVITEHVHRAYSRFDNARLREYVPVLVQREARVTLSGLALVPADLTPLGCRVPA